MNMRMIAVISMSIGLFSFAAAGAADQAVDYKQAVSKISLAVPYDQQIRGYLGLSQDSGQFTLSQINADIVIVEIFDAYCSYSQEHAPVTNKLFKKLQDTRSLKNRIKFIGIGIKNNDDDMDMFRQRYNIIFPIFDDKSEAVFNLLPGIKTPYYFAAKKNTGGSGVEVFYTRDGTYNDEQLFIDMIIAKSGLKF